MIAGCAEVELGAEAVKAINRSIEEANGSGDAAVTPAAGSRINPGLQPAPELFDAKGLAVWDGARTLQGVWVAHPKAETARRVRIIDITSQRAVDGALFRRDEAVSGSSVLISSEAAGLLGMEPNRRTQLRIVALKPGAAVEVAQSAPQTDPAPVEAETAEEQVEVAALDPTPAETVVEEPSVEEVEAADPVVEAGGSSAPPEEALPEQDTEQESTAEAAPSEAEIAEVAPSAEPDPPAETAPAAETTPASEAEFTWESQPETVAETREPVTPEPEVAAAAPQPTRAEPASGTLFVVAGTFGVKDNADRLIERIKKAGFPAAGRVSTRNERTLTQVVAGPFDSSGRQRAALDAIRAMGVPDAIATKG